MALRGNELAIDLGLEVLNALKPNVSHSYLEVAEYCDAARKILELRRPRITQQDIWCWEQRILAKMRRRAAAEFRVISGS